MAALLRTFRECSRAGITPEHGRQTGGYVARIAGAVRVATCAAVLASTACVHAGQMGKGGGPSASQVITEEQIAKTDATTAYEAIRVLQPNFLVSRGPTSFYNTSSPLPNVYQDDVQYGPITTLTLIPARDIASIRLYRAWEATYKFGTGNMGGVIEVYTKH